jgi:hypothetical protein
MASSGCVFGPRTIDVAHLKYNQAIKRSFSRELLLNIVRLKYRESPEFVDIGGVAAQYSFEGSANFNTKNVTGTFDFRDVGVTGNLAGSERPTITYAPLRGKDFETQLLAPVNVATLGLLANKGWSVERILRVGARSINALDNAISAGGPTPTRKPEFEAFLRAAHLLRELQQERAIEFVFADRERRVGVPLAPEKVDGTFVLNALEKGYRIERPGPAASPVLVKTEKFSALAIHPAVLDSPQAHELADLLQLMPGHALYEVETATKGRIASAFDPSVFRAAGEKQELPPALPDAPPAEATITMPPAPFSRTSIAIQGRSLYEMMYYLSQNVEVPEAHFRKGLVNITSDERGVPFDWDQLLGGVFRVHVAKYCPADAFLAVPYRGYWYYIADDDLDTKATLNLLKEVFSLQVRGGGDKLPLLTLGVGR